ncbi:hypothetical protein CEXT_58461 [Caerostris extrusa]|uniref:Uncharacterized protein n=1 Tax=Caerostris extrusa TaxID=172846 RepID=A0AAV4RIE1_CAEEX|nr:hypothetical protein CEXT_58461 [Caerostris extrusa]
MLALGISCAQSRKAFCNTSIGIRVLTNEEDNSHRNKTISAHLEKKISGNNEPCWGRRVNGGCVSDCEAWQKAFEWRRDAVGREDI